MSVYRVQVAAVESAEAAEAERARFEATYGTPAVVRYIPDRGSWRVRVGASPDRAGLAMLLSKLRDAGLQGLWIAEEPASEASGVRLRVVDASYDSKLAPSGRVAVVPEKGATLRVQGKPYRGVIEIRVTRQGTLRAIDWIELESYLRGVVPAELGPEVWPQLEALKAQAVAARTYAVANRGQFEEDGYDLCATPRCQAYGGAAAEHPFSDRAIAATKGEILTWQGKPIIALYTATCGGHTENAGEIFPEQAAPYLAGVPCFAERDAAASKPVVLRGREVATVDSDSGEDVTRDAALLFVAGVLTTEPGSAALRRRPSAREMRDITTRLASVAGRPSPEGPPGDVETLGEAALTLVRDAAWYDRASVLLTADDVSALLRDPAARAAPPAQRAALAYLSSQGALRPRADGTYGFGEKFTLARLVPALVKIGEAYDAFDLREGNFAGLESGLLRIVQGKGTADLPLAEKPLLFSSTGGRVVPARDLELFPGDKIRFRSGGDGKIAFLELRPPLKGLSDDRYAAVYSWEVRKSRKEIEESLEKRVAVGTLQDLKVIRRGASGRIVELKVVGSDSSTTVKGFDVRNLLDLRESLAVVEPVRDASGRLTAVVFTGKGWGHGVGLCQVGAYGMALRGLGYRDILSHYYRGATLAPLQAPAR